VVIVPQDSDVAASEWWDAHRESLFFALEPLGSVSRFEPVNLTLAGVGEMYAYRATMQAEE
jgi:hypothetical protein